MGYVGRLAEKNDIISGIVNHESRITNHELYIMGKKSYRLVFLAIFLFLIPYYFIWADTLGLQHTFFVNQKFDKYERTQLSATLKQITGKLYLYVEDNYWNTLNSSSRAILVNNMLSLANEFENNIYLKEVQLWGSEPNPGVDGDPKLTILFEELVENNGGYFDTSNGYLRQQAEKSNQREMVVVNVETVLGDVGLAKTFLAHEFQHLISFNQKDLTRNIPEEVWLNELRSEYSVSHVGYNNTYAKSNLERRVAEFLESPSDSLTEWPNKTFDYAMVTLFGEYLVEQYGTAILTDTIHSSLIGIDSLNQYFQSKGVYERFVDIFMNWMAAAYFNDSSRESKLGYLRFDLKKIKVAPQQKVFLSESFKEYSLAQAITDWQPVWFEFNLGNLGGNISNSIRLDLKGNFNEKFYASYMAFFNTGSVQLGRIEFVGGKAVANILNSSDGLNRVVVMTTKGTKVSDFGASEQAGLLSVRASIVETKKAEASIIKDGSLIRKRGEKEIYVIWGKYKRYLMPGVISLYGHLNVANAIEIELEVFNSYTTSNYIKYLNDEKVYAVWPEGSKHWLNITPQQWDASGRDWGAIFTINDLEVNYYKTGEDIIR